MTVLAFLTLLTATLIFGARIGARAAAVNRRINADIAFMRAIPADMDWSGQR